MATVPKFLILGIVNIYGIIHKTAVNITLYILNSPNILHACSKRAVKGRVKGQTAPHI